MTFIVNGYDYEDGKERRFNAREVHLENIKKMKAEGKILYAAAMLKGEDMCGSTLILEMDSKADVDAYLDQEAYVVQKVWERVEVIPCKVPPMFRC